MLKFLLPSMIGEKDFEENAIAIEDSIKEIIGSLNKRNSILTIANMCIDKIFKDEQHDFHSEEWDKSIVDTQLLDFYGKKKWDNLSVEEQIDIKAEVAEKVEGVLKFATTRNPNDYKYQMLRIDNLIEEYLIEKGFSIKKRSYQQCRCCLPLSSG